MMEMRTIEVLNLPMKGNRDLKLTGDGTGSGCSRMGKDVAVVLVGCTGEVSCTDEYRCAGEGNVGSRKSR
ncbi:hypothetical protein L6452_41027 [Arctium lappa]|uniref:Uncharacterized protein n=1 Tax=Arctium lappa TaxID=4217 RepID=A0ACB8XNA2_ARCLA|nr:hypothetical protein L6452_41027 [Arctium lappa]